MSEHPISFIPSLACAIALTVQFILMLFWLYK